MYSRRCYVRGSNTNMTKKSNSKSVKMTGSSQRTKNVRKPYQPRVVKANAGDSMTIKHRELVFSQDAVSISPPKIACTFQPGNLPWMRAFANRFEYYEVLSATIEIVSATGANVGGSYFVSIDYDVSDGPPADFKAMMNGGNAISSSVWKDVSLRAKPENIHPRRKLCTQGVHPSDTDAKLYDAFNVYYYCGASSGIFTQMYINYEVRLTVPQLSENASGRIESSGTATVNPTGAQKYFERLKVATDGKIPVNVRQPTPAEVESRNMYAGIDLVELAANSAYMIENFGECALADTDLTNIMNTNGITSTPVRTANLHNPTDTQSTTLLEFTTGTDTGLYQPGINTAQSLTSIVQAIARIRDGSIV